jgi:hypothetical protein
VPRHNRLLPRPRESSTGRLSDAYDKSVERVYVASARLLSALILALGVAMVAIALARGGGALALGVIVGTGLALVGGARLWLARGGSR